MNSDLPAKVAEVQEYLDAVQYKTELSGHEQQQVLDLMRYPGFALVLGLLLSERQGQLVRVTTLRCGGEEEARHLGVLQGTVAGIDRAHQILLECATVPTGKE